ncbi:MAG: hypothetical protein ABWZ88_04875 [Variovorax sp.]
MALIFRWMLCAVWMAGAGWLWQGGSLGIVMALVLAAPAAVLVFWPAAFTGRRRRGGLQYVQMAKEPVAVP